MRGDFSGCLYLMIIRDISCCVGHCSQSSLAPTHALPLRASHIDTPAISMQLPVLTHLDELEPHERGAYELADVVGRLPIQQIALSSLLAHRRLDTVRATVGFASSTCCLPHLEAVVRVDPGLAWTEGCFRFGLPLCAGSLRDGLLRVSPSFTTLVPALRACLPRRQRAATATMSRRTRRPSVPPPVR